MVYCMSAEEIAESLSRIEQWLVIYIGSNPDCSRDEIIAAIIKEVDEALIQLSRLQ